MIVVVTDEDAEPAHRRASEHGVGGPRAHEPALPSALSTPPATARSSSAWRAWVREQTGLELGYVEQLYTFADRHRDPRERAGDPAWSRSAYPALVARVGRRAPGRARWRGLLDELLPWQDARVGAARACREVIVPALARWPGEASDASTRRGRRERADITFGLRASVDPRVTGQRYELLYEAGLVGEAARDRASEPAGRAGALPLGADGR